MIVFIPLVVLWIVFAMTAIFSASSVVREHDSISAIMLSLSSCIGFLITLPFGILFDMSWAPYVSGAIFGCIVVATILCCLCRIKKLMEYQIKRSMK